jgi:hypothetical protein
MPFVFRSERGSFRFLLIREQGWEVKATIVPDGAQVVIGAADSFTSLLANAV